MLNVLKKSEQMNTYYIDGNFVKEDQAVISVNDMIVLRGFGVFDFLRTYNKKPFFLEDHIKRLQKSAELIGLAVPWSKEEIADIVLQTLERNDHEEYNIRLVVTGGISHDSITPEGNSKLMVMVSQIHKLPPEWYTDGVKIVTGQVERCIPGAKTTTYLQAVLALREARAKEAIEAIYMDPNGRLLEGTTTNLFLYINEKLVTPSSDILPGITRQVLLDILSDKFDIEIRDVNKKELKNAQEAFLSASNKEIVPVTQIDDLILNNGKIGPQTQKIMQIFHEFTQNYGTSD